LGLPARKRGGLAIRFDLGGGAYTDLVMISAPMFFVKTPALFVEFLKTVGSGDKAKLDAFFAAHPESTQQAAWLNSHPIPASYAGVDYFGVHAVRVSRPKRAVAPMTGTNVIFMVRDPFEQSSDREPSR
jgi:catalase